MATQVNSGIMVNKLEVQGEVQGVEVQVVVLGVGGTVHSSGSCNGKKKKKKENKEKKKKVRRVNRRQPASRPLPRHFI